MGNTTYRSEIRDSEIRALIERVKKQSVKEYLVALRLDRIRQFNGAEIRFDFPVTALVGPNGGGKTTILLAAGCIYKSTDPRVLFRKSRVGDNSMDDWRLEYELVSKDANPKGTLKEQVEFKGNNWKRPTTYRRSVKHIGISRTLPATDNPLFSLRNRLSIHGKLKSGQHSITEHPVEEIDSIKFEAEKVLGRSLKDFQLIEVRFKTTRTEARGPYRKIVSREDIGEDREIVKWQIIEGTKKTKTTSAQQRLYIGGNGTVSYSEFSFGAGEASVIHLVAEIEELADGSLVLIDEIENGLHPLAVCRLVDYLISVADRKRLQIIFTTHSDYALTPLPSEAIWAALDGRLQQGKLSIEALRAVSGRIDRRLAVFVEDGFAKQWVEAIIRDKISDRLEEIGVYALHGDGTAVFTHRAHMTNPAVNFNSLCIIDGDSEQKDDVAGGVFRLPGDMPELTVFNDTIANLDNNLAILTAACHISLAKQEVVRNVVQQVSHTNRDPHLLFSQVGTKLGLIPEATVASAFLATWISEHPVLVESLASQISTALGKLSKC